jgi:hypothetical protein
VLVVRGQQAAVVSGAECLELALLISLGEGRSFFRGLQMLQERCGLQAGILFRVPGQHSSVALGQGAGTQHRLQLRGQLKQHQLIGHP